MRLTSTSAAALACLGLALAAVWPAPVDPIAMVGHWRHPDAISNHWLLEWVSSQLADGGSLLDNDHYYWPVGDHPLLAGNGNEGFLYLPFHLALPWPLSATAYAVAMLSCSALAGWWSARKLGASPAGALVGAAGFGTSSFVMQELGSGRFSQADVAALGAALGALAALLRAERPRTRDGALLGLLAGFAAVQYWFYGYFIAIAALVLALAWRATPWNRGLWRPLAAAAAVGAAVVAGPLAWFATHWSLIPGTSEVGTFPHREALGDAIVVTSPIVVSGPQQGAAISAVVLALAALAWVRRRAGTGGDAGLVALAVVGWMLARGPLLLGEGLPSLYHFFYGWAEPLRRFWWPSRHLVLMHWAIAMLAARGATAVVDWLASRIRPRLPKAPASSQWKLQMMLGALLTAMVPLAAAAAGDLYYTPISRYRAPTYYRRIASLPHGVLAELPISPRLAAHQPTLAYQLTHHHTLLGGHAVWVDRVRPAEWDSFVATNGLLSALVAWEEQRSERIAFGAGDVSTLRDAGLNYFSHNASFDPQGLGGSYPTVLRALFGAPLVEDEGVALFAIARWTGAADVDAGRFEWSEGVALSDGSQPPLLPDAQAVGFTIEREANRAFQGIQKIGLDRPTELPATDAVGVGNQEQGRD